MTIFDFFNNISQSLSQIAINTRRIANTLDDNMNPDLQNEDKAILQLTQNVKDAQGRIPTEKQ